MCMDFKARLVIVIIFYTKVLEDHGLSKSSKFFIFYNYAGALKSRLISMFYTKALKWSGSFIFDPIDLKIGMHSNGGIGNNFYY